MDIPKAPPVGLVLDEVKCPGKSVLNALACIGLVWYVKILTCLRGFHAFSLYQSFFCKLRVKGNLTNLQFYLENLGAMLEYWCIKPSLLLILLLRAIYCASTGHFRVPLCLCSTMSLYTKPFIWKWVWFAWKWTGRRNIFSYEWFRSFRLVLTQRQKAARKWPIKCNNTVLL